MSSWVKWHENRATNYTLNNLVWLKWQTTLRHSAPVHHVYSFICLFFTYFLEPYWSNKQHSSKRYSITPKWYSCKLGQNVITFDSHHPSTFVKSFSMFTWVLWMGAESFWRDHAHPHRHAKITPANCHSEFDSHSVSVFCHDRPAWVSCV